MRGKKRVAASVTAAVEVSARRLERTEKRILETEKAVFFGHCEYLCGFKRTGLL